MPIYAALCVVNVNYVLLLLLSQAANYDDMRCCCMCKHICIFSAVACECDKTKVSCTRHFNLMCRCPKDKKFLLGEENFCLLYLFVR